MKRLASTLATIWRLSIPYYRSEDRWPGRILLGAVIAIELSIVAITVILNRIWPDLKNQVLDHALDRGGCGAGASRDARFERAGHRASAPSTPVCDVEVVPPPLERRLSVTLFGFRVTPYVTLRRYAELI